MVNTISMFNNKLYKLKEEVIQLPKKLFCKYFHGRHFQWDNNFNIECKKCLFTFKPHN